MDDKLNSLTNKTIDKIANNNEYLTICFTDGTILEVWAVNRLHSGIGLLSKIS
jgi:hypothetical protein